MNERGASGFVNSSGPGQFKVPVAIPYELPGMTKVKTSEPNAKEKGDVRSADIGISHADAVNTEVVLPSQ